MNYLKLTQENLNGAAALAAQALKEGKVVLLPFDTVYGFIADPANEEAVRKIFELKGRAKEKTLGLAVSNLDQLAKIAVMTHKKFIEDKVPGRFTFILKSKTDLFSACCSQNQTLGIRIPDNKLVLEIVKLFGPVAQTSANKSGHKSCDSIDQLKKQFDDTIESIDLIIDGGKIAQSQASQIWDLTGDEPKRIER